MSVVVWKTYTVKGNVGDFTARGHLSEVASRAEMNRAK